jgi:hypothetical protein
VHHPDDRPDHGGAAIDDYTHHGPNSTTHIRTNVDGWGFTASCDDCPWHTFIWYRSVAVEAAVVHACEPHPADDRD